MESGMSKRVLKFMGLAVLLLGICAGAPAQAPSGEIRGTVTDPSGALIASAQVVANGPYGSTRTVTAGRDGSFQIDSMGPGRYTLVISAPGFAPATLESIQVTSGKTIDEKIALQLPVEEQQVQVTEDT